MVLSQVSLYSGPVVTLGIAALAVLFSGLIVLAVDAEKGGRLRTVLEHDGLRAVGKYSYGMYVFHLFILSAGQQALASVIHLPGLISKLLAVIWGSAASFAAAWLSYHLYEKHFLRLKRFFEHRKPAASSAVLAAALVSANHACRAVATNSLPS